MGTFNLIDEPWIKVLIDEKGRSQEVSIHDLFKNAKSYKRLAGETASQDFAILRLLLAILQTVYSRFDTNDHILDYIEVDSQYKQLEELDEDDHLVYLDDLKANWINLWQKGEFTEAVHLYLEAWQEHFFLLDDKYPFYQVTKEEINSREISGKNPSQVHAKTMNRTISESRNKTALFSPRYEKGNNKNISTYSEAARWLIMFQGYIGLSDKVIFGKEKYKNSKGWTYDLGGLYLSGDNLFETLLLNLALEHPHEKYKYSMQKPSWEFTAEEMIDKLLMEEPIDNLSELYTNWGRAIYIDPNLDINKPFSIEIVKLPEIDHQDNFLEIMTMWRFNQQGDNKYTCTPRKHNKSRALWRSFGNIFMPNHGNNKRPGIIDWLHRIEPELGQKEITIESTSLIDDGNPTSWVPADEYYDSLKMTDYILVDVVEEGWVPRIDDEVQLTQKVIDWTYKNFITDIKTIRNISNSDYVTGYLQNAYFVIDQPFRDWLSGIESHQDKDQKVMEWRKILYSRILKLANNQLKMVSHRDYKGVQIDGELLNIATSYNKFHAILASQLKIDRGTK